ncbi:MAG: hypothetical protein H8D42_00725, partial [Candidatus Marinimicrobia bacterium]|nr:hypothetical protein [Candidatus Neomarinimicrobiota bacterium]
MKITKFFVIAVLTLLFAVSAPADVWNSNNSDFTTDIVLMDLNPSGLGNPYLKTDFIAINYSYPYGLQEDPLDWYDLEDLPGKYGGKLMYYYIIEGELSPFPTIIDESSWGMNCLDLGDYDLDGDFDIAVGNIVLQGNDGADLVYKNLWMENGWDPCEDKFQVDEDFNAESFDTQVIKWVDVDSDGDLDLAALEYNGSLWIYENTILPRSDNPPPTQFIPHQYSQLQPKPKNHILYQGKSFPGQGTDETWECSQYDIFGTVMEWCDVDDDGYQDVYINYDKYVKVYKNLYNVSVYSDMFMKEEYYIAKDNSGIDFIKRAGCAAFRKDGDFSYLAVGCNTIAPLSGLAQGTLDDRGVSVLKFNPQNEIIELIWTEAEDVQDWTYKDSQLFSDIKWCGDDIYTAAYPMIGHDEQGELVYDRGETRHYINDGQYSFTINTIDPGSHTVSTSLGLADFGVENVNIIDYYDLDISKDLNYLPYDNLYSSYFFIKMVFSDIYNNSDYVLVGPSHELVFYSVDYEEGMLSTNISDEILNQDDWLAYFVLHYPTMYPGFTLESLEVFGYYSENLDIAVGNDGKNLVYFYNQSQTTEPPVPDLDQFPTITEKITHPYPGNVLPDNEPMMDEENPLGIALDAEEMYYTGLDYLVDNYPDIKLWYITDFWSKETMRGKFYWNKLDQVVKTAYDNGKELILGLRFDPLWTMGDYYETTEPIPDGAKKIRVCDEILTAPFVRQFVNRYRPGGLLPSKLNFGNDWGVTRFQFINEPTTGQGGYYFDDIEGIGDIA